MVWQVAQFASLLNLEGGSGLVFLGLGLEPTHLLEPAPELDSATNSLLLNPEPWEKHF